MSGKGPPPGLQMKRKVKVKVEVMSDFLMTPWTVADCGSLSPWIFQARVRE